MKRIYKYTIDLDNQPCIVTTFAGARVVDVHEQNGEICVWMEHDTAQPTRVRAFFTYGTGHAIREGLSYVGTAHVRNFVWHVYE